MQICNLNDLGHQAQALTQTYNCLILACKGAIQNSLNLELTNRIKLIAQDLGKTCIDLINLTGKFKQNPNDKLLKQELLEQIENVNKNAQSLLNSFHMSRLIQQ